MVIIRTATRKDIDAIVKIHQLAFPGFFLTSLGSYFLCTYYRCMCKSKEAATLCAIEDGKIVGFSATALISSGFNTRLVKKNPMQFIWIALFVLITRPRAILRLTKNMTKKAQGIEDHGNYAELYSIGVLPEYQGKGVGKLLLAKTEELVSGHGQTRISLTTDKNDNEATIAFYKGSGYNVLYDFIAYPNRAMYRLVKNLTT